jgi:hypothetical protein
MVWRHLAVLALSALLAACGSPSVTASVLRFHELGAAPTGKTFALAPESGQEGGLEYKAYARMVAARLEEAGFRPAPDAAGADIVVSIVYSVDDGRSEVWSVPVYGYTDMWRRYYGAQVGWPMPYDVIGTDTHSTTIYTHRLDLRMQDGAKLRQGTRVNLFEGHVLAERSARDLVSTMPYMVTAMFDGFPGVNGVPVKIVVPESKREGGRR